MNTNQLLEFIYMGVGGLIAVVAILAVLLRLRYRGGSRLNRYHKRRLHNKSWGIGLVLFVLWLGLTYLVVF